MKKNIKFLWLASCVCSSIHGDAIDQLARALHEFTAPISNIYLEAFKQLPKSGIWKYTKSDIFTPDLFESTIKEFIKVAEQQHAKKTNWFNQERGDTKNLFVQKLVVPADATLEIHADFHGDVHSLVAWLESLAAKGWFDKANPFKIIKKNGYIICLGDYTDRGEYGAEIIFLLYTLYINNPDKVILLRGNHEEGWVNKSYGLWGELEKKFPQLFQSIFSAIEISYHYLPTALFIGSEDKDKNIDFIVFTHACYDAHYKAAGLLKADTHFLWQRLATADTTSGFTNCTLPIAMQQVDIKGLTDWLEQASNKNHTVWSLLRGHQHAPADVTTIAKEGNGVYRSYAADLDIKQQWNGDAKTPVKFGKNSLWTFNVAPWTGSYNDPHVLKLLTDDTVANVTFKTGFENWIFQPRKITVSH